MKERFKHIIQMLYSITLWGKDRSYIDEIDLFLSRLDLKELNTVFFHGTSAEDREAILKKYNCPIGVKDFIDILDIGVPRSTLVDIGVPESTIVGPVPQKNQLH